MLHDCLEVQAGACQIDLVNEDHSGSRYKCQCRFKIRFPWETCSKWRPCMEMDV